MKFLSDAFSDGGEIPERYGYTRENVHPPVSFEDVPEEAESFVIVMDDPDAVEPAGKVWDHWLIWNIPSETSNLDEGDIPIGAEEGRNDFGERGYGGPNPPDGEHSYRFRAFAVDRDLELNRDVSKEELLDAVEEHKLAEASLTGKIRPL